MFNETLYSLACQTGSNDLAGRKLVNWYVGGWRCTHTGYSVNVHIYGVKDVAAHHIVIKCIWSGHYMVYVNIYATIIIWTANNFVLRDIDNVELQELLITGHGGPGLIRTKIISVIEYVIMQNIKTFQDS